LSNEIWCQHFAGRVIGPGSIQGASARFLAEVYRRFNKGASLTTRLWDRKSKVFAGWSTASILFPIFPWPKRRWAGAGQRELTQRSKRLRLKQETDGDGDVGSDALAVLLAGAYRYC